MPDTDKAEIERLRAKNSELLDEAKAAKAARDEAQAALQSMTAERDQAKAELRRVTLDAPVAELLGSIGVDGDVLRMAIDRYGYAFTREDGALVLRDGEGNVPLIADGEVERPVSATARDLTDYLCELRTPAHKRSDKAKTFATLIKDPSAALGGGAQTSARLPPPSNTKPQPTPTEFGIR